MKAFWDERYKQNEYAYGKDPNEYLKAKLQELKPGSILFPAEGEGRNAVFAAKQGWNVSAFDTSNEGKKKALRLAEKEGVDVAYEVGGPETQDYKVRQFDAIALIYAHFPPDVRKNYFSDFIQLLNGGGKVIFEGFGLKHPEYQEINPSVGGPKDVKMLFSEEEIREAFFEFEFQEFYEGETDLNEGEFHKGKGWVIRFVAEKKN